MNFSKIPKIVIRISIVYAFQLIIKAFDYSFGNFFEYTFRGVFFSVFFISFWLGSWYFAELINKKIAKLAQINRLGINIVIGYGIGFLTNHVYRTGDSLIYDNSEGWADISLLNPEFTISVLLVYLLIYWFNEYLQSNIKMREEKIKTETLQKESTMAQYMALKAQIEPHFLFNSLSVLNSLVHKDADLASEFIIKLSKNLRYIIEKNSFTLVPLKDEITIVEDYFFLIKTRFNDGINLNINISNELIDETSIPPVTIQLLIENAIKHNKLSAEEPLNIDISATDDYILVKNKINLRAESTNSTGKGLENISKRFELISEKSIIVDKTVNSYCVKLPILNKKNYEHISY